MASDHGGLCFVFGDFCDDLVIAFVLSFYIS